MFQPLPVPPPKIKVSRDSLDSPANDATGRFCIIPLTKTPLVSRKEKRRHQSPGRGGGGLWYNSLDKDATSLKEGKDGGGGGGFGITPLTKTPLVSRKEKSLKEGKEGGGGGLLYNSLDKDATSLQEGGGTRFASVYSLDKGAISLSKGCF